LILSLQEAELSELMQMLSHMNICVAGGVEGTVSVNGDSVSIICGQVSKKH
jgi:hypothetical protein